jgi:hypothetical protein
LKTYHFYFVGRDHGIASSEESLCQSDDQAREQALKRLRERGACCVVVWDRERLIFETTCPRS